MEPFLVITNAVGLLISVDTNLITAARVYPNDLTPPYIVHHPQVVTNYTATWTFRSNRYEYTFRSEYGKIDTNVVIKTPLNP